MLSFVVAGIACGFAALCYAELAAMIPVSGSAYTYSYATLGEIIAWIIGWDLILEYAVGNMAVAVGWSGYFVRLCGSLFGLKFPLWLVKIAVVMFVIAFGAFLVHPTNWRPFVPTEIGGVMSGAAIVFFAFIGFDAVSTTAEETKNPQRDMPIGIIASLIICTVLYVLMAGVITGMRKYTTYLGDPAAVATAFADRPWATALISAGALAGMLQCCSFSNSPSHAFSSPWHATGCCRNISQKFTPGFARPTSQPSGLESPSVASRC
jgi:APA family basic amino acid/polyamine antiporter